MPITVTAPRGVLTATGEREILPRLTEALLQAAGAPDSSLIGGTVHVLPAENVYAGGTNRPIVLVELKLPDAGLGTLGARRTFIEAATDIVDGLTVDGHDRQDTWVNILNALDGGWGVGGQTFSKETPTSQETLIA